MNYKSSANWHVTLAIAFSTLFLPFINIVAVVGRVEAQDTKACTTTDKCAGSRRDRFYASSATEVEK